MQEKVSLYYRFCLPQLLKWASSSVASWVEQGAEDRCIQSSHLYSSFCCGPPGALRGHGSLLSSLVHRSVRTLLRNITQRLGSRNWLLAIHYLAASVLHQLVVKPQTSVPTHSLLTFTFFFFFLINTLRSKILLHNHRHIQISLGINQYQYPL